MVLKKIITEMKCYNKIKHWDLFHTNVSTCINSEEISATKVKTEATKDNIEDEVVCTICAEPIKNFVPKFFYGVQINPACSKCDDNSTELNNSESKNETAMEDQDILEVNVDYDSDYEYLQDSNSYSHSFNLEIWGLDQYDHMNFEEPPAGAGN